jgi:hypothetical protein
MIFDIAVDRGEIFGIILMISLFGDIVMTIEEVEEFKALIVSRGILRKNFVDCVQLPKLLDELARHFLMYPDDVNIDVRGIARKMLLELYTVGYIKSSYRELL